MDFETLRSQCELYLLNALELPEREALDRLLDSGDPTALRAMAEARGERGLVCDQQHGAFDDALERE